MKHRLGTATILITAATTSWRGLLTMEKEISCPICSMWTVLSAHGWSARGNGCGRPSSVWWREKILLLFQCISVFHSYFSLSFLFQCHSTAALLSVTQTGVCPHQAKWFGALNPCHEMNFISASFISYIHPLTAVCQGLLAVCHAF